MLIRRLICHLLELNLGGLLRSKEVNMLFVGIEPGWLIRKSKCHWQELNLDGRISNHSFNHTDKHN